MRADSVTVKDLSLNMTALTTNPQGKHWLKTTCYLQTDTTCLAHSASGE